MEKTLQIPPPVPGKCHLFIKGKLRYCRLPAMPDSQYCGEHDITGNRIPCPLDPQHRIERDKLEYHLKRCNSRPKPLPAYHSLNTNCPSNLLSSSSGAGVYDDKQRIISLVSASHEQVEKVLVKVHDIISNGDTGDIAVMESSKHIQHMFTQPTCLSTGDGEDEKGMGKHPKQTAALTQIIMDCMSTRQNDELYFMEFGAGKGDLSASINQQLLQHHSSTSSSSIQYTLIDRKNMKHKKDCRIRNSHNPASSTAATENSGNQVEKRIRVERLLIDIKDFDLPKYCQMHTCKNITVMSKHLCGSATDLTLMSFCKPLQQQPGVETVVIALCCHHCCEYGKYCNPAYLDRLGIDRLEFDLISSMCSWATSGHGSRGSHSSDCDNNNDSGSDDNGVCRFGLTPEERTIIGLQCKRILDGGRLDLLRRTGYFDSVKLMYYCPQSVSLENVVMIASRNPNPTQPNLSH